MRAPIAGPSRGLAWTGWALAPLLLLRFGAVGAAMPPAAMSPAATPPAATVGAAPRLEVSVALPGKAVTVGDRVEAVVSVRAPAAALAAEPRFPIWRGAWGEAEVREQGEPRRRDGADGSALFSQRLVLAAFRPGTIALPPAAIAIPLRSGTVQAWTPAGLALAVRSVLPAGAKELRPRPPAPLRPLPWGAAFFWTLAILLAIAAAGAWALWRRERRRRDALSASRPPLPPLPELLAALDRLTGGETAPLPLHTGISHALRRYLGRTAGFPAPESTTTEIQRLLLARGWPAGLVRPAVELLRACDLVKFARQEVGESRARERLAEARRLGEEIEAHARLAAGAGEAAARLEAAG